ncbi:MAG TPA: arabinan endo-1,5-alpha-L-arabinosidase [Opitutaceae bacterium]|nr:arabinan endo-1,5-alpha-L-arabinosidase [Opitutaceae bacterium]
MKFYLALLALAVAPVGLFAADVSGVWNAAFDTQIGPQKYTYTLKQDGTALSGKATADIAGEKNESVITDGKVDGDHVSFTEKLTYQGNDLTITYAGTVKDDEMKLTRQVGEFATEELVATREKPSAAADAAAPGVRIPIHDPVMARENGRYYIFATGWGIAAWSSPDMNHWQHENPVFAHPPAWAVEAVPGFKGMIWAPDISFHHGKYYLYYAVSAFGKNTSCIGVATNVTLDPADPRFKWEDHGKVIESYPGETNWNAIDPNLVMDDQGTPYLVFGSFWDGIKLAKMNPDLLTVAQDPATLPTIASRKTDPSAPNPPAPAGNPVEAGGNAIEAPFIFKHDGYYYLFASIDYCCRGPKSTYKMIVGRAKAVTGPYVDKTGAPLARDGGTLLLKGDAHWYAVGHCGVYDFDGTDYIIFHAYDATDQGKPKLRLDKLSWDAEGWPVVEVPAGE